MIISFNSSRFIFFLFLSISIVQENKFTCVFSVEEAVLATFLFSVLDLEDVGIDDIADVVGVERRFVEVDNLLIKVADLA